MVQVNQQAKGTPCTPRPHHSHLYLQKSKFYCGWKLLPVNLERNIIPYWPCEKPVIKGSLESQYFMSVACLLLHELFLQVCHCSVSVCNGKKAWTLVHWNEVTLQGGRKHLSIKIFFFCQVPEKERQGIQMSVGKTGCHFLATHSTPFLRTLGGNFPLPSFLRPCVFPGKPNPSTSDSFTLNSSQCFSRTISRGLLRHDFIYWENEFRILPIPDSIHTLRGCDI